MRISGKIAEIRSDGMHSCMKAMDSSPFRAFLATDAACSLSAAARQLRRTQATLSQMVMAPEADLGVALFDRRGRNLAQTFFTQTLMRLRISELRISAIYPMYAYAIQRRTGALQHEYSERRAVREQVLAQICQGCLCR